MYESIFVGVFSGLLTAIGLYVGAKLLKNSLVSWYQQKTYQGVNVSGKWHWCVEGQQTIQLELKQVARTLEGTYTIVYTEDRPNGTIHTYTVRGEIVDRFVQLTLRNNDMTKLGAMVYLLEVVGDGSELKGCCTSYAVDSNEVFAMNQSFFRTSSQSIEYSRVHYGTVASVDLESESDGELEHNRSNQLDALGAIHSV